MKSSAPSPIEFSITLRESLERGTFVRLNLGQYQGTEDLKKIIIKKIEIKKEEKLSFTYTHKTKDIVKNYNIFDGISLVEKALDFDFKTAHLCTTEFDVTLEKGQVKKSPATITTPPSLHHDRKKNHLIEPKHYLYDLGVTDQNGIVLKSAQDKFRQINKYIEILSGLIKSIPHDKIKTIVDMGSGKGYLTFALYDYLNAQGLNPAVTGVEYRADMVALCSKIAAKSGFENLHFIQGTIENYDCADANIVIALHACDTATDDAIAKGIMADAELIVVAPCCHKQIRREIENVKNADLDFLLRHGIFMERMAEMITDGLRALILEYFGYSVKVFEFISDAHTAKNVMIVASKNQKSREKDPAIMDKITAAKEFYGVSKHYLETLLDISPNRPI